MTQTLKLEDVLKEIQTSKNRNKRTCKIKLSQVEYFKDKRPKIFLQTLGVDEVEKKLEELGYFVDYEKHESQMTIGYDAKGAINKCNKRDLKTKVMIIKW